MIQCQEAAVFKNNQKTPPKHFLTQTCFLFVSRVLLEIKISAVQSHYRKAGLLPPSAKPHQQHCFVFISCVTGKPLLLFWLSQSQTRAPLSSSLCPQTSLKTQAFCTHSSCKSVTVYHQPARSYSKKRQPLELAKDTNLSFPRPLKNADPRRGLIHIIKTKEVKSPSQVPPDIRKQADYTDAADDLIWPMKTFLEGWGLSEHSWMSRIRSNSSLSW